LSALVFYWVVCLPALAIAGSQGPRDVVVWNGAVRLSLPVLAEDPVQIGDAENAFSVRPSTNRPDLKYVIFVIREPLRADEKILSGEALKTKVEELLQTAGYEVIGITHAEDAFVADFRAVMEPGVLPWQKVGPGIARGKAKFVRTADQWVGSVLLCDPSQWKDKATQSFIKIVEGTSVMREVVP